MNTMFLAKNKSIRLFSVRTQAYSSAVRYTKTHEWVSLDNTIATTGITDYAQKELGDVVYVEIPEVGREFNQNEVVAIVESVKAASDIMMPIGGTITEANTELETSPQLLNSDPLKAGWIAKFKSSNVSEFETLLTEEQYQAYLATLSHE